MEQVFSDNVMRRWIAGSGGVIPIAPFTYLGEEGTQLPENVIASTRCQYCRTQSNSTEQRNYESKRRKDVRVFLRANLMREHVVSGGQGYGLGAKKRRGRPEESLQSFEGSAIRSMESGSKASSTNLQAVA